MSSSEETISVLATIQGCTVQAGSSPDGFALTSDAHGQNIGPIKDQYGMDIQKFSNLSLSLSLSFYIYIYMFVFACSTV